MSGPRVFRKTWLTAHALLTLVGVEVTLRWHGFSGIRAALACRRSPPRAANVSIEEVCDAVNRACSLSFSSTLCLRRSVATALLLRRGGMPAELVLGITPLASQGHAWVQIENRVVNDPFFHVEDYVVVDRL